MKRKINNIRIFICLCLVAFGWGLAAQPKIDLGALKKKYKGEDVAFLKIEENYTIDIKGDELKVKFNNYSEMVFLTDNATGYAEQQVSYTDFMSTIEDFTVYTFVPKEKSGYKKVKVEEIEERKNTSEDVFYDDVSTKFFKFPQPVEGSIGVLDYTEVIKDPHFLGKFYFAHWAPTEQNTFRVKVHKNVQLNYVLKNPSDDIKFEQTSEGNYYIYTWTRSNFPKVKYESQAKPMSYESPHVILYIASYKGKTKTVNVLRNTRDLYDYCYSLLDKGIEEPDQEIKRITDSLTVGVTDDIEKVRNIYYYVQQHVKYIAIEDGLGGFIPRKPSLVCSRKYGDCKDIANLLYTMLNYAKIPTYHTWIGTNDIPYRFDELPIMGVANHMIAAVWLNNRWYFLDGTANFLSYKYPSDFIQGKQAMISINKDSFLLAMVPVISAETNLVTDTFYLKTAGDTIKGNAIKIMDGLSRCSFISALYYTSGNKINEILEEYLEVGQNNCVVTNIKTWGVKGRDSLLKFTYNFKVPKYINQIEDKIYINLNIHKIWDNSDIDIETRSREFIFDKKNSYHKVIIFEIPDNFTVTKLPDNFSKEYLGFGFKFNYELKNNKVIYTQKYWFDTLEINKLDFENWNKLLEHLYKAYTQTIVLKAKK
ncbi:MAG: DUF3857 domain-containing protein [Bacteroidia bacterium]